MDPRLLHFARQWAAVALASLAPVVFSAFVSIPLALGHHPGEAAEASAARAATERHPT